MLYYLVKVLTNIFLRVYYRFDYRGLEKVPYGKPVVLAPNHVNAFVDPVLIGMVLRNKVRFFARGDVFKGTLAKMVLESLNISPMYRIQEGFSELKKNDRSLEECRRLLAANKTILLFPEAVCVQEKRLRPLKKGLARIIFQTEESFEFKKDVLVVPVGLNYTNAKQFRSKLVIDYGDPVSIKEYGERYKLDKVKTINDFTKTFERKLAEHLVIIKNPQNDALVDGLEEIFISQWIGEKGGDVNDLEQQYLASKEIAEKINRLDEKDPDFIASIREKVSQYIEQLRENYLRDHLLRPENINRMSAGKFMLEGLIIYLAMPLYGVGLLFNYPPYILAKRFCDKKIKSVEFYASVYANLAMIIWLVYYGIQLLLVGLIFRNWAVLGIYAGFIPLLGIFVLYFYPLKQKIFGRWRLMRMVRKKRQIVEELMSRRAEIIQNIERIKQG